MANRYFSTSIGRKVLMALSALFLLGFLLQHFLINILSVFSPAAFNSASHFMGTFWLIQYVFQPILIAGVLFHFIMGFVLELQNRNAREVRYAFNKPSANSTWMSRNMMWSGLTILAFLVLHFIDFWIPEMVHKYVETHPEDPTRYYHELVVKFENPI
ncbi:MAG: succinate dehydrogenase cytochrome b subunit, partial [Bacteroidetes bacterium]|nr:succinate dehydrogenase cytochrome b subunit [Bacteroidota bacterium]